MSWFIPINGMELQLSWTNVCVHTYTLWTCCWYVWTLPLDTNQKVWTLLKKKRMSKGLISKNFKERNAAQSDVSYIATTQLVLCNGTYVQLRRVAFFRKTNLEIFGFSENCKCPQDIAYCPQDISMSVWTDDGNEQNVLRTYLRTFVCPKVVWWQT